MAGTRQYHDGHVDEISHPTRPVGPGNVDHLGCELVVGCRVGVACLALPGQGQAGGGDIGLPALQSLENFVQVEGRLDFELHAQFFRQQACQRVLVTGRALLVLVVGRGAVAGDYRQLAAGLNVLQAVLPRAAGQQQ